MCGSKGTATSTSTYSPPASVQANYDELAARAKQVAATPFTPYTGEMVAGLTPSQTAGIQNVNSSAATAQPYYQAATGLVGNAAQTFGQPQLDQYMSPYINSVAKATQANLNETNAQQQQQLLGNAISQGAFGGDRAGIAQAELARQQGLSGGQTMANIYQGGYGQALAQFNADQARQLQAGSTLGQLGTGAQTAGLQGGQAQMAAGATQQAVQQAQDVANQQQFQAQQSYPFQTTQYLANLLLGIGGQSGGTALTSQPQGNIGSSLVGGLLAAGQAFGPAMMASDERVKENIEPVGKTFDGQNIYKYNYKGSPTTNIGLIAQEVEEHHPSAVYKTENGMRMVDYDQATGKAASKGHFARGGVADSMGGAVEGGLGRAAYALQGGVDSQYGVDIPYSDQPTGGSSKPLSLADVMRVRHLGRSSPGWSTKPSAPSLSDEGEIDPNKIFKDAMADPTGKANLQGWASKLIGNTPGTVSAKDVIGNSQGTYSLGLHYADGGLVGRKGYAGDDGESGEVTTPNQNYKFSPWQTASQLKDIYNQSSAPPVDTGHKTLGEMVVGRPLSDEANMGLLAAGLGMMASKSPIFGLGVAQGAQQGLGTYYSALKNKRDYENQLLQRQLDAEKTGIEQQNADTQARLAGLKQFEDIRQMYDVKQDERDTAVVDPITGLKPMIIKDPYGHIIPYDEFIKQMVVIAKMSGLPLDKVIQASTQRSGVVPAGRANGERIGFALGGLPENQNEAETPNLMAPDVTSLAKSILSSGESQGIDQANVAPKIQVAENVPAKTKTDVLPEESYGLDPNDKSPAALAIKRFMNLQNKADAIERQIGQTPFASDSWKSQKATEVNSLRSQAYEIQKQDMFVNNQKVRVEPGAEEAENIGPKPISSDMPHGVIDEDTGRIKTVPVNGGYENSYGFPTTKIPKHTVRTDKDPLFESSRESSKKMEDEFMTAASGTSNAKMSLLKFASAAKQFETGALTSDRTQLAGYARALGFDGIAEDIDGGKPIGEVQKAMKSAIDTVIGKLNSSFSRPTQAEFRTLASQGSPSVDLSPEANHSLIQTQLAALLWQEALARDWYNAKSDKMQNFEAYQNRWRQLHDASLFEDAAGRILGNFKGQASVQPKDFVEGATYVVPNMPKGYQIPQDPSQQSFNDKLWSQGFQPGEIAQVNGIKHSKENGVDQVDVKSITKVDPENVYRAMITQPGVTYGQ